VALARIGYSFAFKHIHEFILCWLRRPWLSFVKWNVYLPQTQRWYFQCFNQDIWHANE
jgi:hypothetical protein